MTTPTSSVLATVPSDSFPNLNCPKKYPSESVAKSASSGWCRSKSVSAPMISTPLPVGSEPVLRRELHAHVIPAATVVVFAYAVQHFGAEHHALGRVVAQVQDAILPGVVVRPGLR